MQNIVVLQNFYTSATFSGFAVTKLFSLKAFQVKFMVCIDISLHTINFAWKALRLQSFAKPENVAEMWNFATLQYSA